MRRLARPRLFVALALLTNALLLAAFASQLSLSSGPPSLAGAAAAGAFFASWAVDLLVVAGLGALLVNGRLPWRLAAYALFAVHFLANALQLAAHWLGGEFLSSLAVANLNHIALVLSPARLAGAAAAVAIALSVPLSVEMARGRSSRREAGALCLGPLALAGIAALVPHALPAGVRARREGLFEANNVTARSPLVSLVAVLAARPERGPVSLSTADALAARRNGFEISPGGAWPLRKERIYDGPPPFPALPGAPARPNVIVFFTEGLSARLTGPYGSPFPGITPNLDRFAADPRTMVVTHYFNHTAATYRGLQGQLCSMYPAEEGSDAWIRGGAARGYYSLADYLDELGYRTTFLDAHRKGAARIDAMTRRLGFAEVLGAEELAARYLGGAEPLRSDSLSDHQLFGALAGFLAERQRDPSPRPFFVALYNLETHAFQDSAKDGVRYGDGRTHALDTVHNVDDAFGRFWDAFLRSPLAATTVVVFTADHCHYPTKGYVDALRPFVPGVKRLFVDAIPLIVYSPFQRLPETFDAEYRTSLDLAPSLIHLLGLPQRPNPFLGRSIFSDRHRREDGPGIASIGPELFFVDARGVARRGALGGHAVDFWRVQRLMRYLSGLEETGRIWPQPETGSR